MRPQPAGGAAPYRRSPRLQAGDLPLIARAWWVLLRTDRALRRDAHSALAGALAPAPATCGGLDRDDATWVALQVARAAARHVRPMACLPRALTLCQLLRERGQPARLRIGVGASTARFAAHAWVEVDGNPVGERDDVEQQFLALLGDVEGQEASSASTSVLESGGKSEFATGPRSAREPRR